MIKINKNYGFINDLSGEFELIHLPCYEPEGSPNRGRDTGAIVYYSSRPGPVKCNVCGVHPRKSTINKYNFISQDSDPYKLI